MLPDPGIDLAAATHGPESMTQPSPTPHRAELDDKPQTRLLPLKKARAGQRHPIRPQRQEFKSLLET
jgi:hypothetical protein